MQPTRGRRQRGRVPDVRVGRSRGLPGPREGRSGERPVGRERVVASPDAPSRPWAGHLDRVSPARSARACPQWGCGCACGREGSRWTGGWPKALAGELARARAARPSAPRRSLAARVVRRADRGRGRRPSADQGGGGRGSRSPRAGIRDAAGLVRALAGDLTSISDPPVRGVALVSFLVCDPMSPLYNRHSRVTVAEIAGRARAALSPG